MLYEKNEVIRMLKLYGNLKGCETYLANARTINDFERIEGVIAESKSWLRRFKEQLPKEIREELADTWNLEQRISEAEELYNLR